jgi:transcriptional regulator with XRE-family HTH domain
MNQQKTGELLKRLRKEKGLTQEQLAEKFYISSRTVSRWETGSSMPDVVILIELADFYNVDIREIIDGERKSEIMDIETKETLLKVAEYTNEENKMAQSRVLITALGICITLILCTLLFAGERPGLLYGVVPESVCNVIFSSVYLFSGALIVAYLRVRPFREKPSLMPEKVIQATVVSKEIVSGTHNSGRSHMGYSFVIRFQTDSDQILELFAYEEEFGRLKEGMQGTLTYQGRYFVCFK